MKYLPDVTLLAISSTEVEGSIASLLKCQEQIKFGAVKFVSHKMPENLPDSIIYEYCPKITNIGEFDVYAFEYLYRHVKTSHMLMCQSHAYILRPELWDDEWLKTDYLGAIWPERPDFISVSTGEMVRQGNGGFSLRSKKILEAPSILGLKTVKDRGFSNDDGLLCSYYRKQLLDYGIKYGTIQQACVFSHELDVPENAGIKSFGFHRYPN